MNIQPVSLQETVFVHAVADALADRRGPVAAGVGQDEGKFVAAEARHDVGFARAQANQSRGLDQRPAAV
jgi:hypothetical protein